MEESKSSFVKLDEALALAREAVGRKEPERGAELLGCALSRRLPPYSFFARAGALVEQLSLAPGRIKRSCRIAVIGGSTTALLMPILKALCLRDSVAAQFYEGPHGSFRQEVLDPGSALVRFKPDIVFLAVHWRDLNLPALADNEEEAVSGAIDEYLNIWRVLGDRLQSHVVQFAFDYPGRDPYGYLSAMTSGARGRTIERINSRMREERSPHVSILDVPGVQRRVGAADWSDQRMWHAFQQHPSTLALPRLAHFMMAHLRGALGCTAKTLVVDLDNTIWKGVVGEDGLDGIEIGPGSPEGEAHAELQRYLAELKSRGILLAVCSKNNLEDALLPFEEHSGMVLRTEDFASFKANWKDKASNLREIADELALDLDSFVFLDDSPFEREWVRQQLPEVSVVEPGDSIYGFVDALDDGLYFHNLTLSEEDRSRADQYGAEARRKSLKSAAQTLDGFLSGLQLEASVEAIEARNIARVTQLTNKTNQFNLTAQRYTETQVAALAARGDVWSGVFRLRDRMGDYGIVGVVLAVESEEGEAWEIDTWLMSCRVLGRQMENFMFDCLATAAASSGIRRLVGVFRPTGKNKLVKDHFSQLGFVLSCDSETETRYELGLPTPTKARFIRTVNA